MACRLLDLRSADGLDSFRTNRSRIATPAGTHHGIVVMREAEPASPGGETEGCKEEESAMKIRIRLSAMLLMLAAAALMALAGSVSAQTPLAGSKHDLSTGGAANSAFQKLTSSDYLCKPCHTPHKATANADMPLLNHTLTTFSFSSYTTKGLGTSWTPGTIDLVCLSCHDGTVAVDAWSGNTGTVFMIGSGGDASHIVTSAYIGTDLSGSHPTSVTMPAAGGEWSAPTNAKLFGGTGDQVKCASCHNPHGNVASGAYFLRTLPASLCQECHNK
jgi:predicted CXXCH cytochrome family protein